MNCREHVFAQLVTTYMIAEIERSITTASHRLSHASSQCAQDKLLEALFRFSQFKDFKYVVLELLLWDDFPMILRLASTASLNAIAYVRRDHASPAPSSVAQIYQ